MTSAEKLVPSFLPKDRVDRKQVANGPTKFQNICWSNWIINMCCRHIRKACFFLRGMPLKSPFRHVDQKGLSKKLPMDTHV